MERLRTEVVFRVDEKYVKSVQNIPKTEAGYRKVLLPREYAKVLKRIIEKSEGDYLFMDNGKRITSQGHRKHLYRICYNLGIPPKSPHKVRRTYGTTLIDSKVVDDSTIMEMLGHKDIATTRKYYYLGNKNEQKKLNQLEKALSNK